MNELFDYYFQGNPDQYYASDDSRLPSKLCARLSAYVTACETDCESHGTDYQRFDERGQK